MDNICAHNIATLLKVPEYLMKGIVRDGKRGFQSGYDNFTIEFYSEMDMYKFIREKKPVRFMVYLMDGSEYKGENHWREEAEKYYGKKEEKRKRAEYERLKLKFG